MTAKRLVITEKPSVARDICAALGGFEDHDEYFEGSELLVTWAVGHLLELSEPQDYDPRYRAWTVATLPIIPEAFTVKPKDGQKKRLALITKLARRKDVVGVINACDAGREGELIFRRIYEYCNLDGLVSERLWLQSMTPGSIRAAFESLRPGDKLDRLADAAWLRGVGDWLIGMNATRALTKRLKGRNETGAWSAGRVQTPTLNLLVRREREILAHVPKQYWEVNASCFTNDQGWSGRYWDASVRDESDRDIRPQRIFDRARVDAILAAMADGAEGVAAEKRKPSRQSPPLLFDLTMLQREANRRFSFSAKRTLNAAQRLYEGHKLITYPRTDSRHLPGDYGPIIDEVLAGLTTEPELGELAGRVREAPLNLDVLLDDTKVSDHFAIVPTVRDGVVDLSGDDARIYELIVRRFLAAMMGPATWATVERTVEVAIPGGASATFRTTARSLEIPGFLEALGQEEGAGTMLPPLVPGQDHVDGIAVQVASVEVADKLTQPPSRLTEAALLGMMETAGERVDESDLSEAMRGRGLGTPATRADIIERLVSTQYLRRLQGKLGPTPKGMRLMDILERAHATGLASPRLTGEWEYALQQVEDGELQRSEVLDRLTEYTRTVTQALVGFEHADLYAADADLGPCPACGEGRVRESAWGYPCTRNEGKDSACSFMIWKDRNGRYIDRDLVVRLLRDRTVPAVDGFVDRFGNNLTGNLTLEEDDGRWTIRVEYGDAPQGDTPPEEVGEALWPCPCGVEGCQIVETSQRYVCREYLEGRAKKGPILPKTVCHREMAPEEVEAYFGEAARTELFDGFVSKRGRGFRGLLFRKPTGKHGFEFPPREPRGKKADGEAEAPAKKATARKKAPAKKASAKGATEVPDQAAAKKAPAKKTPAKKASSGTAAKKATAKKATTKEAAAESAPAEEAAPAKASRPASRRRTPSDEGASTTAR